MTAANDGDEVGVTPVELVEEHTIAGIDTDWTQTDAEWDGHDYSAVPIPDEEKRPKWEWSTEERRAYLLKELREHGHAQNLPKSQSDYGDEFGITQASIWQDMEELRRYIRFHAGNRAISDTEIVAQRAVAEELEQGNPYKALRAQLEYNEWLFELGRFDRAPKKQKIESVSVSADAEDLTDEEEEHFASLAEQLSDDSGEIIVEAKDDE